VHSSIKNVTFDCADALVVARFWAAALGTDMDEESTSQKALVVPMTPPCGCDRTGASSQWQELRQE
jgi:hypothetical protein